MMYDRVCALVLVVSAFSSGGVSAQTTKQALEYCRRSNVAGEKEVYCSTAIQATSDRKQLERLFLRRGNAYVELKKYGLAIADFSEVIRLNPRVAGYFDNRLNALRQSGRLQEAMYDANSAVRLAPGHAFVYRSRALVLEDMQRFGDALTDFDRASSLDPANEGLTIDRARVKVKAGRIREAIAELSLIISQHPSNFDAFKGRGMALLAEGNLPAAKSDLVVYASANPGDQEVRNALSAIDARSAVAMPVQPPLVPKVSPPQPSTGNSETSPESSGTGFFISSDGYVVTNAHVVEACSTLTVNAGLSFSGPARVLARDSSNDLALLKVETVAPAFAQLRAGVRTGESVAAFGYPLRGLLSTSGNFTVGNISALSGLGDDTRFIQISAPVQPGNSGGPVLDSHGNVVAVVVSKLNVRRVAAIIDDVPQNVNFAIKATVLSNFLDSANAQYGTKAADAPLTFADLADKARKMSVYINCGG